MVEHVWIHQTQLMWHLMPMDTSASVLRVLEGLIVKVGHLKKKLTETSRKDNYKFKFCMQMFKSVFSFF